MFCRYCGAEVPDDGAFCAKCGRPVAIATNVNIAPEFSNTRLPPQDMSAPQKTATFPFTATDIAPAEEPRSKSKKSAVLIIGVVLLVFVAGLIWFFSFGFGAINENNVPTNAVYNINLGVSVRLGQAKKEVDKLLGAPQKNGNFFYYDSGLAAMYRNGKASALGVYSSNKDWITYKKMGIDTTTWAVNSALGNGISSKDGTLLFSFDAHGKSYPMKDGDSFGDAAYYVEFHVKYGRVTGFLILSTVF